MDIVPIETQSRKRSRPKKRPQSSKLSRSQRFRRNREKDEIELPDSLSVQAGMDAKVQLDNSLQQPENELIQLECYGLAIEEAECLPLCTTPAHFCNSASITSVASYEQDGVNDCSVLSAETPLAADSVNDCSLLSAETPLPADSENDCSVLSAETPLPAAEVSFEEYNAETPLPSGRFICNLAYVIQQVRKLEKHSTECFFEGKFVFKKITLWGLASTLHFVCSSRLCNAFATIQTEEKDGCLNQLAVLGALSSGSGFAQEEEKFSTIGVRYMSRPTFILHERTTGEVLKACVEETLIHAVEEEKRLSELRSDIDGEGYYCISAIIDGGWCKRSYGHGYNASSGVAVIIGMETQKILFVGVRNKVCLTCQAIENGRINNKDHLCWKNWNGPSTAMESDIVVEGLKYLENVHQIRCTRLIGDGDANTMVKVQERVAYGNRVLKVECANHATRRYGRALERLQLATARFPTAKGIQARKILKSRIPRLVKGARTSIKKHAIQNHNQINIEVVNNLIVELRNGPNHVFGFHGHCGSFCTRQEVDPEAFVYDIMKDVGMLQAVIEIINRILNSCANSLIWNATNNPAENFMSQFCKATGGKRIDYAKAGGINRRVNVAALAYQTPAQQWHIKAHKAVTGQSPNTPLTSFLRRRQKLRLNRLNRRKLFPFEKPKKQHIEKGGDKHYGDQPEQPDMTLETYDKLSTEFLLSLNVSSHCELEELTRNQSSCEKWREERAKRISSTLFKDVAERRATTLSANLVKRICYRDEVCTPAMKYGKANEMTALEAYQQQTENNVKRCGLFVDPKKPFLCTSPDGLIDDDGLVEVKCPYTARFAFNLTDICKSHDIGIKLSSDGSFYLPFKHKYFYQIQGQLAITKRSWCDLFVWCRAQSILIRIQNDVNFWNEIVPKLERFYMKCVLPEMIDPRVARGMPLREPQFILDAVSKKNKIKQQKKQNVHPTSSPKAGPSHSCQNLDVTVIAKTACATPKRIRRPKIIFDL